MPAVSLLVIHSARAVRHRVRTLSLEVMRDVVGSRFTGGTGEALQAPLTVIGILDSAFMFTADFVRSPYVPDSAGVAFVKPKSDHADVSDKPYPVELVSAPIRPGHHLVILDVVVASVRTMRSVNRWAWRELAPASVRRVALLADQIRDVDYYGWHHAGVDTAMGYGSDRGTEGRAFQAITERTYS